VFLSCPGYGAVRKISLVCVPGPTEPLSPVVRATISIYVRAAAVLLPGLSPAISALPIQSAHLLRTRPAWRNFNR